MTKKKVLECCGHSNPRQWIELTSNERYSKRRFRWAECEHCGFIVVEIEYWNIFGRLERQETRRGKKGNALFYELKGQTLTQKDNTRVPRGNNAVGYFYAKPGIDPKTKEECQEVRALGNDRLDDENPEKNKKPRHFCRGLTKMNQ